MASLLVFTLALLGFVLSTEALSRRATKAIDHFLFEEKHQTSSLTLASPRYLEQNQDNFDGTNTNTWLQAYYVNDTFWQPGSDAPVFLCVGGEGPPLDGSVVVASPHCNIAVEYLSETKAIMFAVEHRYYGCHNMSACPVKSFNGTSSLHYLSSRQALADLANFHDFATKKYGLTEKNKWISFGGSYPGMLAGWFRLKYPHLVHGSIASSAPVQAKLDMQGYNNVVAQAYTVFDNNVGGSQECHDAIATGHATIGKNFQTSQGRTELSKLFGETPEFYADKNNQADFAGNGVAYFPAQGNDPSCTQPACNIKMICEIMTNSSIGDPINRLAMLRKIQQLWIPSDVYSVDEEPDYWGYQTCTEFGFYQTCEVGTQCFFTQGLISLESQMSFCGLEFSIPSSKVAQNINLTNDVYGGDKPAGTCLLYPNGEVDPWHSLSILKSPSPGIGVLMVAGASHHAWTHPSLPTDQDSVNQARETIRGNVSLFLSQPCEQSEI
eukprot:m.335520 g.335520  ORF g.335520 m.335520 type:complete len:495 (-) comp17619_c0_seq1:59-1543(-)